LPFTPFNTRFPDGGSTFSEICTLPARVGLPFFDEWFLSMFPWCRNFVGAAGEIEEIG
jgi:hypothetical protein